MSVTLFSTPLLFLLLGDSWVAHQGMIDSELFDISDDDRDNNEEGDYDDSFEDENETIHAEKKIPVKCNQRIKLDVNAEQLNSAQVTVSTENNGSDSVGPGGIIAGENERGQEDDREDNHHILAVFKSERSNPDTPGDLMTINVDQVETNVFVGLWNEGVSPTSADIEKHQGGETANEKRERVEKTIQALIPDRKKLTKKTKKITLLPNLMVKSNSMSVR